MKGASVLTKRNIILCIVISSISLVFGLTEALIGVTIVDLKYLYKIDTNQVSYGFIIGSACNFTFSAIWAVVFRKRFDRRWAILVALLASAILCLSLASIRTMGAFFGLMGLFGISQSAFGTMIISWVVEVFEDRSSPQLQLQYLLMSLGYLVAPLFTSPYLIEVDSISGTNLTSEDLQQYFSENSRINVPLDIGAIVAFMAMIILILQMLLMRKKPNVIFQDSPTQQDEGSMIVQSPKYVAVIIVLGSLMTCANSTIAENTGKYLMTYLTIIKISKVTAASMVATFGSGLAIGRLAGVAYRCQSQAWYHAAHMSCRYLDRQSLNPIRCHAAEMTGASVFTKRNIILCIVISSISLVFGLTEALIGVTIVDLKYLYKIDTNQVSYGFIIGSACNFTFSAIWAVVFRKRFDRRWAILVALLASAILCLSLSSIRTLGAFFGLMGIFGISQSAFGTMIISWVVEVFDDKSSPQLQLQYLLMSIGYLIAPLFTSPYLIEVDSISGTNLTSDDLQQYFSENSKINVPLDIGAIVAFMAMVILILQMLLMRKTPNVKFHGNHTQQDEEGTIVQSSRYVAVIIVLGSLMTCANSTIAENTGKYLMTYLTIIKISKVTAANMVATFGSGLAIGRLAGVAIAVKVRPGIMLLICLVSTLVGNLLILFGGTTESIVYVGVIVLSVGKASLSGSVFAFINQRVKVTNFVAGLLHFGSTSGPIFYPLISGPYY
ncbi:hypothetical protein HDE_04489 [Halotydeus destructor]|nr:hypothetical protein HDE_04489 [Halotydeus destructor]